LDASSLDAWYGPTLILDCLYLFLQRSINQSTPFLQVQTNLQQVDVNKWVFELPDANNINHITVFLLGTIPFDAGYGATVHILWPNKDWKLLGW
jgi:Protein of unknown function (DUF775)